MFRYFSWSFIMFAKWKNIIGGNVNSQVRLNTLRIMSCVINDQVDASNGSTCLVRADYV